MDKYYCDVEQGFLLIRGENVELAGEIDENADTGLTQVHYYFFIFLKFYFRLSKNWMDDLLKNSKLQVSVEELQKLEEELSKPNKSIDTKSAKNTKHVDLDEFT